MLDLDINCVVDIIHRDSGSGHLADTGGPLDKIAATNLMSRRLELPIVVWACDETFLSSNARFVLVNHDTLIYKIPLYVTGHTLDLFPLSSD
jgi:hypothetical protein